MAARPESLRPGRAPSWAHTYLTAASVALNIFHFSNQGQVEAGAKAVLQEERGARAVEPSLGDDGNAVPEQVSLIHVVSGHDDGSACGDGDREQGGHQAHPGQGVVGRGL